MLQSAACKVASHSRTANVEIHVRAFENSSDAAQGTAPRRRSNTTGSQVPTIISFHFPNACPTCSHSRTTLETVRSTHVAASGPDWTRSTAHHHQPCYNAMHFLFQIIIFFFWTDKSHVPSDSNHRSKTSRLIELLFSGDD